MIKDENSYLASNNINMIDSSINESDLSMSLLNSNNFNPNINLTKMHNNYMMFKNNIHPQPNYNINDTMFMQAPQNFQNNANANDDTTLLENKNLNNNNNPNFQFFPNLLPPMQPGLFLNTAAPKVIYPQIDPTKNLNYFISNGNFLHPNILLEPVTIENIYLFNKKFNIEYEQSTWYIFNPLNNSTSLPFSSKQIYDMYQMKIINGEIDIRPIDIFMFINKNNFSFNKLKIINDVNWVDNISDSELLKYTELYEISEKVKSDFIEIENKINSQKDNLQKNQNNNTKKNDINYFNSNLLNENDDDFEIVGHKSRKNTNINTNQNNKNLKKGIIGIENNNKNPVAEKKLNLNQNTVQSYSNNNNNNPNKNNNLNNNNPAVKTEIKYSQNINLITNTRTLKNNLNDLIKVIIFLFNKFFLILIKFKKFNFLFLPNSNIFYVYI